MGSGCRNALRMRQFATFSILSSPDTFRLVRAESGFYDCPVTAVYVEACFNSQTILLIGF